MPQNLLSQKNSIIAVVILVVVLGGGYAYYSSTQDASSSASSSASSGSVDPSLFTKDVAEFYKAKDSINFKDLSFMKKSFYNDLRDNTVEFPPAVPTGRPNPFWAP
jgi:hypothetical protein